MVFFSAVVLQELPYGSTFFDSRKSIKIVELPFGSELYWVFSSISFNHFTGPCLVHASKIKGCEVLAEWIQPIRNHFWHCAEACNGDATKLKVITCQTTKPRLFNTPNIQN